MAAAAAGEWAWMAEVASEELAKLEAEHPALFGPLKAELKRLIADPGFDAAVVSPNGRGIATSSQLTPDLRLDLVPTQESSSRKRSRCCGNSNDGGGGDEEGKRRRSRAASGGKDRAEMAIERAERCLARIRAVKASLLGFGFTG
ncbi:hypothetical protein GUJ93_ZPchr0012g18899 [Zizania palustris]|uniref:Uncharacterized protein n=1 Tax=Zizania palustris TaxID=103762 RepID=A0A8J5WNQ3_ZIZPA|nr:hypothetical protein GUJ93_ZPchr0012g18899 [Zizania palustris]